MLYVVVRIRALVRHYALWFQGRAGIIFEHAVGIIRFSLWAPRVSLKLFFPFPTRETQGKQGPESRQNFPRILARYINLDYRQDRRDLIEVELRKLPFIRAERVSATRDPNGSLGCAQSHIEALGQFLKSPDTITIICEDDLEFIASSDEIQEAIKEFWEHPMLDVLCLSFRLRGPRLPISQTMAVGNNIQTAACYVVKRKAARALLANFLESKKLLISGAPPSHASIDITWKTLQARQLIFAIPRNPLALQRESYSDIAKKVKKYRP